MSFPGMLRTTASVIRHLSTCVYPIARAKMCSAAL